MPKVIEIIARIIYRHNFSPLSLFLLDIKPTMHLKSIIVVSAGIVIFLSCNNKSSTTTKASFCDTVCMQDSLTFVDNNNKLKPYVYISAKNCSGDTLTWGFIGQNKNIPFEYRLSKDYSRCYIKDTSYALLVFNTCENGRG